MEPPLPIKIRDGARRSLQWIRYRIGEVFLRAFVATLPWLPEKFLSALTRAGFRLAYHLLWKYPRRMEINLASVMTKEFPSQKERQALVRRSWSNFATGIQETAWSLNAPPDRLLNRVRIEGEENLKKALEKKKGVIALSAHLGNFTLIGAYLAAKNYSPNVIIKQPRDTRFAQLMDQYRLQVGIKTISARPRRVAAQRIIKALRSNGIVLILADELKSSGAEVEFFGRVYPFPRGPVTLAMRVGAPVLPLFMIRDSDNRLILRIEPELELQHTGILRNDVTANVALFARHLETVVRLYPDQWNWLGFRKTVWKPRRPAKRAQPQQSPLPPEEDLNSSGPRPPL